MPSVPPTQETPTRAPAGSAGEPPSTTSPTIWWPGMRWGRMGGRSPSMMCRSVRQTPQANTRRRTYPEMSLGRGTSSTVRMGGAVRRKELKTAAFTGLLDRCKRCQQLLIASMHKRWRTCWALGKSSSVLAVAALDGVEEFGGVVAYSIFEYDLYVFDVGDFGAGVTFDDDEIGVFAGSDGADVGLLIKVDGSVEGGDLDGFDGSEASLDEELDLALVAVAGQNVAVAG